METQYIERQFKRIGARVRLHPPMSRTRANRPDVSIDIGQDSEGEFFDISVKPHLLADTEVIDVQPSLRHLLLMSRQRDGKHKFLCGHDERHWFVAAVPDRLGVASVKGAFTALKPAAVQALENRLGVKPRQRNRRRNDAFVRQGEWFFVPVDDTREIDERLILRNEPIWRGRGKPHRCEELIRQGGTLVYVAHGYPQGLTEFERTRLISRMPQLRHLHWVAQRRNPFVFVRGSVRHPDHKTVVLDGWHQVMMNTENEATSMRHVAFLD